jgi:hypothetical protein
MARQDVATLCVQNEQLRLDLSAAQSTGTACPSCRALAVGLAHCDLHWICPRIRAPHPCRPGLGHICAGTSAPCSGTRADVRRDSRTSASGLAHICAGTPGVSCCAADRVVARRCCTGCRHRGMPDRVVSRYRAARSPRCTDTMLQGTSIVRHAAGAEETARAPCTVLQRGCTVLQHAMQPAPRRPRALPRSSYRSRWRPSARS